MSAGIGQVPPGRPTSTSGRAARIDPSLYDQSLPAIRTRPGVRGAPARIPPRIWEPVRRRAADAPADLVPGLLGSTLARGRRRGARRSLRGRRSGDASSTSAVACPASRLPGSGAARASASCGPAWRSSATWCAGLRGDDLLIAIERPPPAENRELAIGIAGAGIDGTLTSDSTRMRGYVLSTTSPRRSSSASAWRCRTRSAASRSRRGAADPAFVERLGGPAGGDRTAPRPGDRHQPADLGRARGARRDRLQGAGACAPSLPLLAVAVAYLPAVLLLIAAALEPERARPSG